MDVNKIISCLQATLIPDNQPDGEKQLNEMKKIVTFVSSLLQIIMHDQLDIPVRQAGAIYLKNMISGHWEEKEVTSGAEYFFIHEQDKIQIRNNLVEAIISAPDPLKNQLGVCASQIIKHDYPAKWPEIAEKILNYLQSDQANTWQGALYCLYQIVKNYEYKKAEEREPLNTIMRILLPVCFERLKQLMTDQSQGAVSVQKQILKIFYAMIQFYLPLDLLSQSDFTHWMELFRQILARKIPDDVNKADEEERCQMVWWKIKKWSLHILTRSFERYGSPGNVSKEYASFAKWYVQTFSQGVLHEIFQLLDGYCKKEYVSPRVIQQSMNYLTQGICHSVSWKFIKPHMTTISTDVIFPLLCHTEEDAQLWDEDPIEYIRMKYDVFEEFYSPVVSARSLLHTVCSKRKEVLNKTITFCLQLLSNHEIPPQQRAGALSMIGAVADVLLQKKMYRNQIDVLLLNHVFPEFESKHGYLRSRACNMIQQFAAVKFKQTDSLRKIVHYLNIAIVNDVELPVKVEGSMALQELLSEQPNSIEVVRPLIKNIIVELLKVIHETENDELTTVLQKLVCTFSEEVIPLAVDITTHLAHTFAKVIDSDSSDSNDDKAIAAMGILNTIDTIVAVMEEQPEIVAHIEGIVLEVIGLIIKRNVMEFYEEILSLICSLTTARISDRMWTVFPMLKNMFDNDGFDYFTDMLPALHNYATVDPEKFKSNPAYIETIFNMCRAILTANSAGEDAEAHAAKLLEVLLLQYRGELDGVLEHLVTVALERLTREIKTCELRGMCLQVVVAALHYNPELLLSILSKVTISNSTECVVTSFIRQWISDIDVFLGLHDRKVCVLGLCTLVSIPPNLRPDAANLYAKQIMPAFITLFEGLERAYKSRAEAENSDDENEYEGDDDDDDIVDDEDDIIDDEGVKYLETLDKVKNDEYDDDDEEYDMEETLLETYETPLDKEDNDVDEYDVFACMMAVLPEKDPVWFKTLTEALDAKENQSLQKVIEMADRRRQQAVAKKIEMAGGYQFTQQTVPNTFNFANGVNPGQK